MGFKHAHKQASGEIHKNCKPTSTPATYVTQWSLSMHTKTPGSDLGAIETSDQDLQMKQTDEKQHNTLQSDDNLVQSTTVILS